MTPIEFSGTLTRQDVARAMRTPGLVISGGLLVLFGSISTIAAMRGHEPWYGAILPVVGVALLLSPRLASARLMRTSKTISAQVKGVADEEHIEFETQYGRSSLPWPVFYRVRLAHDFVALYHSASMFHLLPRRYFAGEAEWEAFRAIAASHVQRRSDPSVLRTAALWCVITIAVYLLWSLFTAPAP